MANKNVNILLKLVDKFTSPLNKANAEVKKNTKQVKAAANQIQKFADDGTRHFKRLALAAGGFASVLGGLTIKTAFGEAMDLEGYRMQLETATKDTQKATEVMQYAIELANKTPFEGGELVEGAAKFEAFGLAAQKWLPYAGDMAAATNKDFDQAVEALIDAQSGELERLKEFGITKAQILEQGAEMFSGVQIANNKGQIVNQEKFNEAMLALMSEKFSGGMEKQATTVKGLWSTVTGVTKNALANIIGMQNDGTIKSGSLLDFAKEKVTLLAETLQKWQSDGTIDQIATKVGEAFNKVVDAINWAIENADTLIPIVKNLFLAFTGMSVLNMATQKISGFIGTISTLGKGTMSLVKLFTGSGSGFGVIGKTIMNLSSVFGTIGGVASKFFGLLKGGAGIAGTAIKFLGTIFTGPLGIAISIAIAAGVAIWKNWDTIKEKATQLWTKVKEVFEGIKNAITEKMQAVKDFVQPIFDWFDEHFGWIGDGISKIVDGVKGLFGGGSGNSNYVTLGTYGGKALGTPYFQGGATRINEGGRGEIVNLPNGTQIIPHDVARKMGSGTSVVVNLTIQGNVIGNRQYMEQTGDYIAKKILAAQGVV